MNPQSPLKNKPGDCRSAAYAQIRMLIRNRFRERGAPLLKDRDGCWVPAAALWTISRSWVRTLREAGVKPGGTVAATACSDRSFVGLVFACLHEGIHLMPLAEGQPPPSGIQALADPVSATCILLDGSPTAPGPYGGGLLLRTSGTTGTPDCFHLSPENLLAVWESHLPRLAGLDGCRAWCDLPLHHAFGLVLDLFPALLRGEAVLFPEDPSGGMDAMLKLWSRYGVSRCSGVPLFFRRLFAHNPSALSGLQGGLMGGAPCPAPLADALRGTAIQPGYGLTEASPGVMLGEAGVWTAGELGTPVGCEVKVLPSGELCFRGPNAVTHCWEEGNWVPLRPDRWVRSGDRVESGADGRFQFRGRTASGWKLDNGRWLQPEPLEETLIQSVPGLKRILILPGRQGGLDLLIMGPVDNTSAFWATQLEGLASRLERVCPVPESDWPLTPKGETDRKQLQKWIRQHAEG